MATDAASVTGVILAGGRARRMGNRDKGLIELRGRPMIEYVIRGLAPQVDRLVINANRNLQRYAALGFPVVADTLPDHAGPLAGLLAAMQQIDTPYLLCVPCDGPWLPDDLRERLQTGLREARAEIGCVHDGERLHPVYALLERSLSAALKRYLEQGGRAMHRWFESRRLARVDFSDHAGLFVNINTPADLRQVTEQLDDPYA